MEQQSGQLSDPGRRQLLADILQSLIRTTVLALGFIVCATNAHAIVMAVPTEEPAPTLSESIVRLLGAQGIVATTQSMADPVSIVDALVDGRVDLAIMEEPELPVHDLATLAPLYPSVLHVLHNRQVDRFEDLLRGANIYAGPPGGAAHRLLMALSSDFLVAAEEFRVLDNPWTEVPDVYFVFGGLLPGESLAQLADYRLFSFARPDDVAGGSLADGIAFKHRHLRPFLIPRGVYAELAGQSVLTLSTRTVIAARAEFPEGEAVTIAETLFKASQELAMAFPLVTRELREPMTGSNLVLPLHNGTRRYLDRDRPGFVERNVDVIALYFTMIITVVTSLYYWLRRRAQVRKDRIDAYYGKLLILRQEMESVSSGDERVACREHLLDLQREVMELLMHERIESSHGMVAFVNMTNHMLRELDRRR